MQTRHPGCVVSRKSPATSTCMRACLQGYLVLTVLVERRGFPIFPLSPPSATPPPGSEGVVRALLSAGAMVNARDDRSSTPLHWACMRGREGVIRLLVSCIVIRGLYYSYHSISNAIVQREVEKANCCMCVTEEALLVTLYRRRSSAYSLSSSLCLLLDFRTGLFAQHGVAAKHIRLQ